MKTSIIIIFTSFLLTTNAFSQDEILGNWFAKDLDNSTIQIYRDGLTFYGKIISSDIENYFGTIVLKEFEYDDENEKWKGTIYSVKRKMNINGTLNLEEEGKMKVIGKKYFMTKTFYWIKAD